MEILIITLGIVVLLYVLHRLALAAESRGWIFYKTRAPRVRTLGLFEELVDPKVEYMVEEQSSEAIRADQSEQGDGYRDGDEPG
jgi:hypothetical protein